MLKFTVSLENGTEKAVDDSARFASVVAKRQHERRSVNQLTYRALRLIEVQMG